MRSRRPLTGRLPAATQLAFAPQRPATVSAGSGYERPYREAPALEGRGVASSLARWSTETESERPTKRSPSIPLAVIGQHTYGVPPARFVMKGSTFRPLVVTF